MNTSNYRVSICIPTCNRPDLLAEAITSCLSQTRLPDEIVIGDDSKGHETQDLVAHLQLNWPVRFNYKHNVPRLGQGANINSIYQRATGTHFILLHDDDLLLPNAIHDLLACWHNHPDITAAYGKQYIMSHDGIVNVPASEEMNRDYLRTPDREGLQERPWEVGFLQQLPCDGFMVTAPAARAILWRSAQEVGYGGEFDFGLRLSLAYQKFYFFNEYTTKYRKTAGSSISSSHSDDAALQTYRIVKSVQLPAAAASLRPRKLSFYSPMAMMQAIRHRQRREAWDIYLSTNHGWRKRLSPGGVRRLALLLSSYGTRETPGSGCIRVAETIRNWLVLLSSYHDVFGVLGALAFVSHEIIGHPREIRGHLKGIANDLHIRVGTSDNWLCREILLQGQYALDLPFTPETIVDAGANIGLASIYYASRYPQARIFSIEAEPSNFKMLCKNVAHCPNIVPIHAALWKSDGSVSVEVRDPGAGPSEKWGFVTREGVGPQVRALTLPTLMREFNLDSIDLLKMDIEGAEIEVFEHCNWVNRVQAFAIELHDRFRPGCSAAVNAAIRNCECSEHGELTLYLRRNMPQQMSAAASGLSQSNHY